ncbi:putative E3 ubiquitin ligase complex SCF subunit [Podosphaera aphanis]|nr:putative E3 ubiquitin ligase complex SCF subunit [Podosphaera aphanis]
MDNNSIIMSLARKELQTQTSTQLMFIQKPPLSPQSQTSMTSQRNPDTQYCYRHRPESECRRTADEPTMEILQMNLKTLPHDDQKSISNVWSLFSAAPAKHRNLMLQGILAQCCFPQLSYISSTIRGLIRIDFITALPSELSLRILSYLDTTSLCKSAQVSRSWRRLADDDVVWHRMCEQHIDRKCNKCGWGLPLLERKRLRCWKRQQQLNATDQGHDSSNSASAPKIKISGNLTTNDPSKRGIDEVTTDGLGNKFESAKRQRLQTYNESKFKFRPWKDVYKDRFQVGSNWKYGRYSTKIFKGHTNGVTCLQLGDNILATGSYDSTIKIWNIDTGECIRTLVGHTCGIRALQFDDQKLISGSLDKTVRIWNWRTGDCLSVYLAHQAGVIALNFVDNILASGSIDKTVKVWNFEDKSVFVLQGHTNWVNAVRVDAASRTLFSASDDLTIRLWDLDSRQTIQTFEGHVGQVQQVLLLPAEYEFDEPDTTTTEINNSPDRTPDENSQLSISPVAWNESWPATRPKPPRYMLTGALDSTFRLWDVASGHCLKTFFGHLEGIWALAGDTLRVVTGAEDKMVKVWDIRTGKCEKTFIGHTGPVTCIGLSDSRMCTGSEDCEVRLYNFKHTEVTDEVLGSTSETSLQTIPV